jgi:GT2 family glycosyltransferase
MHVDIIIATHNRAALLDRCLSSILATGAPVEYAVTVVDNGSTDDTAAVIARLARESGGRVRGLSEALLGKSHAVNAGIAATAGPVVAFADDDQTVGPDWLPAIHRAFVEGFDFVSGPVDGEWEVPPPAWYDVRLRGAVSLCDAGRERFPQDTRNVFSGGNAAVSRDALERIGGLHTALGKIAGRFTMCEDGELLLRLKRAGCRGVYDPAMRVLHVVSRDRVSKRYFRRWHRGYGHSMALVDELHPQPVPYWFGVPRFLARRTLETVPRALRALLGGDHPGVFEQELHWWFMFGYLRGKLSARPLDPAPPLLSAERRVNGPTVREGIG